MTQILEPRDYSKNAIAVYRSLGKVYFGPKPRRDAEILVVRLRYRIDGAMLDKMPHLTIIASPTTGMNHIDVKEAQRRGIKIISLRGRTGFLRKIPSTAELTWGLLLALVRKIPASHEHVKRGGWDRDLFRGHQLCGKTLGILGYGRLGKIVGRYGRAFGMKVIACDPVISAGRMKRLGSRKVSMERLFREADIISVHVLLTEKTHNLVKTKHLRMMKPAAYLINTSRGEIIEKGALEKALAQKWIAGAAVDVLWDERGNGAHLRGNPLRRYAMTHDNLILVPHTGGATYEAMAITEDFIAALVKKAVR